MKIDPLPRHRERERERGNNGDDDSSSSTSKLEAVLGSWRDLAIHPYTSKALERENLVTTTMIIIPIAMSSGIIRKIYI